MTDLKAKTSEKAMNSLSIGPGTQVTLHFALNLDDGSTVDSNFDGDPAIFTVGDGSLLQGFEKALFGLLAGDEETFSIAPEQGFGQRNPSNKQEIPRDQVPPGIDLEEGLVLSFADAQHNEIPGVISEFDDDKVIVDFNHPLAGRQIEFVVRILDVEPAITH